MGKCVIGVDFGTLSARALVAEAATGRELAVAAMDYTHGVMDETLPDGTRLMPDWALQDPRDYLDCLQKIVPEALQKSGVPAAEVVGLGLDFTACTVLPVDESGAPLCFQAQYHKNPYAYAMLWKHHAAQDEANRLTEIARSRGEPFLSRYGGKISSEWMFPKIWQVLREAPEVYEAASRFVEAGDFLVWWLTGSQVRSGCLAGYKALWHKRDGYPSQDFFRSLDPRLENVAAEKLAGKVLPVGAKAGEISPAAAQKIGLLPGTAVAVANVDAHVSMPAAGPTRPGDLLMIMGTSCCHLALCAEEKTVPGMCGAVEDGIIPGLMGYEAGQNCVGDLFNWFVKNCLPEAYAREAQARGLDPHEYLTAKAQTLKPGQSGLLALDWWNGNRSVLVDADLTGMILGLTLLTKPEEIYRALIEATAYGARMIFETFEQSGVAIERVYACGGISQKNPLVMQIYADVLGREIRIVRSKQAPALGSAMFGAVAAGAKRGGYDSIADAASAMGGVLDIVYRPNEQSRAVYQRLYAEYARLYDAFGRGGNDVMKRLKAIRAEQTRAE